MTVTVGGNVFVDGCETKPSSPKPWTGADLAPMRKFWEKKSNWFPSWNAVDDENAMQLDYIRVYSLPK